MISNNRMIFFSRPTNNQDKSLIHRQLFRYAFLLALFAKVTQAEMFGFTHNGTDYLLTMEPTTSRASLDISKIADKFYKTLMSFIESGGCGNVIISTASRQLSNTIFNLEFCDRALKFFRNNTEIINSTFEQCVEAFTTVTESTAKNQCDSEITKHNNAYIGYSIFSFVMLLAFCFAVCFAKKRHSQRESYESIPETNSTAPTV